ncbi:MAG TPA: Wzz/FepE/Etk N-terminal domain-containing protein [Gammaproteobacteria bacterium]|nr:Wzz/FepE/Etk N-terminal domain-containing protein [Gammaproteobacteria bacterium]
MNTEIPPAKKTGLQNPNASPMVPQGGMLQPPWIPGNPVAGEIDLVDLGIVLWLRRRLMLAVFLVFVILTITATVLKRPTYEYSTTVQLGNSISQTSGNVVPLMSAQSAAQTMQDTYIPSAMNQYALQYHLNAAALHIPKITATGDINGSNVVLSCRGRESLGPVCTAVEKIAADAFLTDNSRFVTAAKNQMASLKSQATVLQVQLDKLNTSAKLYKQQQTSLQGQITRMEKARIQAAKGATSGSAALSNLILNTEVQKAMDSLNLIEQQLDVSIPQQRAQFSQQLDDNLHAQQLQEQTISQGYVRTLNVGLRSLQPVGLDRMAVLVLGVVLSLILAVFAALIAAYVGQVHARIASRAQS